MIRRLLGQQSLIGLTISVACLVGSPYAVVADHPFHMSRAQMDYNAETDSWEVALCVFVDDFATAVGISESEIVQPDTNTSRGPRGFADTATAYLSERFVIECDGQRLPLHWVGHEIDDQQLWLYFEIPVESKHAQRLTLRNTILLAQFDDQVNDVVASAADRCCQLSYHHNQTTPQTLPWSAR